MTGARPPRGPGDNPWRGGRPSDGEAARRAPVERVGGSLDAELEELPVERMAWRRESRLGLGAAIGLLALAGLLAGGFGVLGGRQDLSPSPAPSAGAVGPTRSAAPPTPPLPTPAVTPFAACGPDPGGNVPMVLLQTNGVPTSGLVERLVPTAGEGTPEPTPEGPRMQLRGPSVAIQPDVVTELWIDGAACALRWFLILYDSVTDEGVQIDQSPGENELDPQVAAQNRFNVTQALAARRDAGHELQLIAALEFEQTVVAALWRVTIHPVRPPVMALRFSDSGDEIPLVPGCNQELRLANGYQEVLGVCDGDVSETLGAATIVGTHDRLQFEYDGFVASDVHVTCGRLSGFAFIAEPEPGCVEQPGDGEPFQVGAPDGVWVLAISACVSVDAGTPTVANSLCGVWYARVAVKSGAIAE